MIFSELNPALQKIATLAQTDGAEAEVLVTREDKFSVSSQKGRLDKFDSGLSLCAGVRVIKDGQEGYCSTENLSEAAILQSYREALESARFNASHGGHDKNLGLVEAGAQGLVEVVSQGFGKSRTVEQKMEVARKLEEASLKRDPRVVAVPYNGYIESTGAMRVFNTKGVDCAFERGSVYAYAYALAKDGDESRTGNEMFFTRSEADMDPTWVGQSAAEKAVAKLGSVQPETGVFPVLFDLEPAAKLIGQLAEYLSGKMVSEKRSLFASSMGAAIASPVVTIVDDPFIADGPGSRPFDSEGTKASRTTLLENGVLKSFLLNSVYARKLGLKNTGHAARSAKTELDIGPSNLVVQPGAQTREQLLKKHPRTIVVTDLAGFHAGFQAGSGNFSLQAEGELWENGARVAPLCDFIVSGSYKELLTSIEGIANKAPRPFSSVITPEFLVSGLSVAGRN